MRKTSPTATAALLAAAAAVATGTAAAFSPPGGIARDGRLRRRHRRPPPPRANGSGRTGGRAAPALRMLPADSQNRPTELPDSMPDAAAIAAEACRQLHETAGTTVRCRVDFDTSVGDETYTTLKSSTDFMQQFVSSLCLASVPGVREWKMDGAMRLAGARAELAELRADAEDDSADFPDYDAAEPAGEGADGAPPEAAGRLAEREAALLRIVAADGADPSSPWAGPKVRVYFPDEGSAALARRDWSPRVPPCVEFASCGGVQPADTSGDSIILFFCPRASESEFVEELLYAAEGERGGGLLMSVMVNPLLVDMGVTGFGMAGRRLRERLIDGLVPAYYLRTLPWGALTRVWPQLFTVWQEDDSMEGGYRMIKALDTLPSNPEVEDIYDIENGDMKGPSEGLGILNALGDFVNGLQMM